MSEGLDISQLRLLDANANRAREGIRTAEDYLRFNGGDGPWAARLKTIRNAITDIIRGSVADERLVASRDAAGDPLRVAAHGTSAQASESPRAGAQRGRKRAQEAVRVLEENLRGSQPGAAMELARHRYTLYEGEQWLLECSAAANILNLATVYVLLTESICKRDVKTVAEAVLRGGAKVLQLREKNKPDKVLLAQAQSLNALCREYGALLICNDSIALDLLSKAAGVHLGQEDLTPGEARRVSAHNMLLGRSTHSLEQARQAVAIECADYIAIGSIFPTATKHAQVVGVETAKKVCEEFSSVPVFAIGGLTLDRVEELTRAGIRRVAVSAAIIGADDPETATRRFVDALAQ